MGRRRLNHVKNKNIVANRQPRNTRRLPEVGEDKSAVWNSLIGTQSYSSVSQNVVQVPDCTTRKGKGSCATPDSFGLRVAPL